jgi:hypothetical protein
MKIITAALIVALLPTISAAEPQTRTALEPSRTIRVVDESRGGLKWLIVGMIAAQAADIMTTSVALRRGCAESTYYGLQSRWAIGGIKAAGTIVLSVTLPMAHTKKPRLTKAVAWAQIASGALGATINTTRLPQCR